MGADDKNSGADVLSWAVLGLIVGGVFGALGGGVLLTELSKSEVPTGSSSAFGHGFIGGGVIGGLAGIVLAIRIARSRSRRRPLALSPDDARQRFDLRMGIRRGATLASLVGVIAYFGLLRQSSPNWAHWFGGLWFFGAIGMLVGSRCPACGRFLDAGAIHARACRHCATSFGERG